MQNWILICLLDLIVQSYEYNTILINKQLLGPHKICLFIHGHRGHFTQANSLSTYLINFCHLYSIDFQEDISGLSHEVLYKQANYISSEILELYSLYNTQIIIISHSMGGISTILAAISSYPMIFQIITLNSPLESSPLNSYFAFPYIYSSIHSFLQSSKIQILSITGGADAIVPASLTKPKEIKSRHIYTTQIAGVYKQLDHNEILYNKEFLLFITDTLKGTSVDNEKFHR